MSVQKECYICRKLDSNISGKLIRIKFCCNIHNNNWVCKKNINLIEKCIYKSIGIYKKK